MLKACSTKQTKPNLSAVYASQNEVINRLIFLRTQRAGTIVLEVVSLQPRRSPATIHQSEPDEKLTSWWRGDLAQLLGSRKRALAEEESFISRGSRVLLVIGPLPDKFIFTVKGKLYVLHPFPGCDILSKSCHRKGSNNVCDPTIVVQPSATVLLERFGTAATKSGANWRRELPSIHRSCRNSA
jgi:hypothetical protein